MEKNEGKKVVKQEIDENDLNLVNAGGEGGSKLCSSKAPQANSCKLDSMTN